MGSMSIVHWMIVIGIVVLLFGRHKISDLMGDVAQGIKSFKTGMADNEPTAEKPGGTRHEKQTAPQTPGIPVSPLIEKV
jgi:sec-independent protein translocase protein TatA